VRDHSFISYPRQSQSAGLTELLAYMCSYVRPCAAALQSLLPTYEAHLDDLPGFPTIVDYSVTAIARPKTSSSASA